MDVVAALVIVGNLEPFVDTLATGVEGAAPLSSVHFLAVTDAGVEIFDETDGSQVYLEAAQHGGGALLDGDRHLLLLDNDLMVWDGTWLRPSPLDDLLPLPAEAVGGHSAHLWLLGGGEVFHHTGGVLSAVTIDTGTDVRQMAPSGGSLCAVMAPFLMVLDGAGGSVSLAEFHPERLATSLTFDADSVLWLSDGSTALSRRTADGQWGTLEAEAAIEAVHGNPSSDAIWLRTASGALHHRDGEFHTVAVPEGDWVGVDALGRLLVATADGLSRVAVQRSVGVAGLLAGAQLDDAVTLAFAPTGPDTVTDLQVWVDTQQLEVDPAVVTAELDPIGLSSGAHVLRMAAVGPEGTTLTDLPFTTGELPDATWDDDIDVIAQEHCSRCHGDGAAIPLHTADLWRINIDRVLAEVVSQDMPLGGPYLSDDEVALIRGWQAGGFP